MRVSARPVCSTRCAYCRGAIAEAALTCPACATLVHDACQLELPACPTLGCGSLAPWEWTPAPGRERRPWRAATLLAAALPIVFLATSVTSARSEAPGTTEAPPRRSAWAVLGRGAELGTWTEEKVPGYHVSYTRLGPCSGGWGAPQVVRAVDRRYRVLWELDELVRLEVKSTDDATHPVRPERPAVPRFTLTPDPPGEPATVTVPAGTFACTYRREPGTTDLGLPCTVETWSVAWLPLPLKRVVTWHEPRAPAEFVSSETTVLTRIAPGRVRDGL
ncbi:MAG: hypothetical protein M9894_33280 [Planctomycetes bacterium]|nr:hypothetical protein [Planctomycetota bacterium]